MYIHVLFDATYLYTIVIHVRFSTQKETVLFHREFQAIVHANP